MRRPAGPRPETIRECHERAIHQRREVPEELREAYRTDPVVAAMLSSYLAEHITEAEMWRHLALAQTRAKADALKMTRDVLDRHTQPVIAVKCSGDQDQCPLKGMRR